MNDLEALAQTVTARRVEAAAAVAFAELVDRFSAATQALDPDGKIAARAATVARDEAVSSLALYVTAVETLRRAAVAAGPKRLPRLVTT